MSNIPSLALPTMTSLELVDFINASRAEGEAELRHDSFMAKVPKVLGGVQNLLDTYIHPQNGQTYSCYRFPKREACLMAMSYSYELQAKVFDRMTELEARRLVKSDLPEVSLFRRGLAISALLNVPEHLAQVEVVKEVRLTLGVDFSNYLKLAPAQQNIQREEEALEPTDLGKSVGLKPIQMNRALESAGLQVKAAEGWLPTEAGAPYASRHQWVVGGKSGYNWKWKRSVLKLLSL